MPSIHCASSRAEWRPSARSIWWILTELWLPLFTEFPPRPRNDPSNINPAVLGLLAPGVTLDQANAEFTALAKRLATAYPATNKQFDTGQVQKLNATPFEPKDVRIEPIGQRRTAFADGALPIFWRDGLPVGWSHTGACLIEEADSVIYIPSGTLTVDAFGSLELEWSKP